jgi:hypothetical protein
MAEGNRGSPLSPLVARQLNPAITGDEVRQGVAGEKAWTKGDSIRGFARWEAHRRSRSTVMHIDGEEAPEEWSRWPEKWSRRSSLVMRNSWQGQGTTGGGYCRWGAHRIRRRRGNSRCLAS